MKSIATRSCGSEKNLFLDQTLGVQRSNVTTMNILDILVRSHWHSCPLRQGVWSWVQCGCTVLAKMWHLVGWKSTPPPVVAVVSNMRYAWEHPENILRTSENILRRFENILKTSWDHLKNVYRTFVNAWEHPKNIWKHLRTSEKIWESLQHQKHLRTSERL